MAKSETSLGKFVDAAGKVLLWLALLLALAGSLYHVAATFASVDGGQRLGWLQAVAIDVGLFALAFAITQRKRAKRPAKLLWLGVVVFSVISIYANLAYALQSVGDPFYARVAALRPYVLAAALPILVLYLAEIVGDDTSHAIKQAERAKRAAEREELAKSQQESETEPAKSDDANGHKPFLCEICGYEAGSQQALNAHMRAHSQQRAEISEN